MSPRRRNRGALARKLAGSALVFAALGDETRLSLVAELSGGTPRSIAQLTEGCTVTRQAVTKHLRILETAGLVRAVRQGRESRFELAPHSLEQARRALEVVSREWDRALERLRRFVER